MIRKHKIWIIIGSVLVLLLSAFPTKTKGMEEYSMWDITLKGDGQAPYFQSSVRMEIDLKGTSTKEDVTIFINKQKWEGDWDYDQSTRIIFKDEGNYEVYIVHQNGYEEMRKIIVELNDPTKPKINTGFYKEGTWTNHKITLKAYGSKAISKISHYEYKIGNGNWKVMKDDQLEIDHDMDDQVMIRSVSNTGRQSEIQKVWCRLWSERPNIPKVNCDQHTENGWYQRIPTFTCEINQKGGPPIHSYIKLVNLETKQTRLEIDNVPMIKKDGKYQLEIWSKDEAGNTSEEKIQSTCFIDTKKPEIFVEYGTTKKINGVLKYQKAKIKIRDQNLVKRSVVMNTSATQIKAWKQEGDFYQTEIVFERDGRQNLQIKAKDLAGNELTRDEKQFVIDTKKPEIEIDGIQDGKSYKKPVNMHIRIKDKNLDQNKTKIYLNQKKWNGGKIKKDGFYTVQVETQDLAGNTNAKTKYFTLNQRGIAIQFLQKDLIGKNISIRNLKPGFRITSLEPVQIMEFLVNGQKVAYQWKEDKVYVKDPILDGKCKISLQVKDANGDQRTSEDIVFFYDTKSPVIKIQGIDKNAECVYGKKIILSLENGEDHWRKVILDGKKIACSKNIISFNKLDPGVHVLELEARDLALNKTKRKIKFKVTKVIPDPVKNIVKTQQSAKKKEEKQESSKSYLWIVTGFIIFLSFMTIRYRKSHKQ